MHQKPHQHLVQAAFGVGSDSPVSEDFWAFCTTPDGRSGVLNAQGHCVARHHAEPRVAQRRLAHDVAAVQAQRHAMSNPHRPTQMDLMMKANAMAGAEADVATLGAPRSQDMSNDPRTSPPGTLGAFQRTPQKPAVRTAPLAPLIKSTHCGPGQSTLPGGQCGHLTPAAPMQGCSGGQVQYGTDCFDLPPAPNGAQNPVLLALKAMDTRGQPALRFFAHAPDVDSGHPQATKGILAWTGSAWAPTKMDQSLLSQMRIAAGNVPRDQMLATRQHADGTNSVALVPAVNVAKRPVVGSVAGPAGTPKPHHPQAKPPPHKAGGVKTVLNAKGKGPLKPLGAGMAEFFKPKPKPATTAARRRMGVGAPSRMMTSYITKRGDTLASIARAHGLHPQMLSRMNPAVILTYTTPMSGGFRMNVPNRG